MGTQHTFSVVLCAVAVTLQRQRGAVPAETVRTFWLLCTAGQGRKSRLQLGCGFCLLVLRSLYSIWCFTEYAGWPLHYAMGARLGGVPLHAMLL